MIIPDMPKDASGIESSVLQCPELPKEGSDLSWDEFVAKFAKHYAELGYHVLPCNDPRSGKPKAPRSELVLSGVKDASNDVETVVGWWEEKRFSNVGIAGGNGLIMIDLDVKGGKDGVEDLRRIAEDAGASFPEDCPMAKTPSGGVHLYFRCENSNNYSNGAGITYKEQKTAIDVRTDGGYVLAAPSAIPVPEKDETLLYKWERPLVPMDELPLLPEWLANALPKKRTPTTGQPQASSIVGNGKPLQTTDKMGRVFAYLDRTDEAISGQGGHAKAFAALGRTCWGFDLTEPELRQAAERYNETKCEPQWSITELNHKIEEAMKWVSSDSKPRGYLLTEEKANPCGLNTFQSKLEKTPIKRRDSVMSENDDDAVDPFDDFYAQDDFPLDAFPSVLKEYIGNSSLSLGRPPQMIAVVLLPSLAAAIGTARVVGICGEWEESCILWGAPIASSASMKSIVLKKNCRRFFSDHDKIAKKIFLEKMEEYDLEVKRYENLVHEFATGKISFRPTRKHIPPKPLNDERISVDSTTEAFIKSLSQSYRGRLWFRDELVQGIFGIGRYAASSNNGDLGFFLEAYDGGEYEKERVGDGDTTVEHNSVSMVGGIQSNLLWKMTENTQYLDTGFFARFMFAYIEQSPDDLPEDHDFSADAYYVKLIFDKLFELETPNGEKVSGPAKPTVVKIDKDAIGLIIGERKYYKGLADKYKNTSFEAFAGKMAGRAARIALVLHCVNVADQCPFDDNRIGPFTIPKETVEAAIKINRWFAKESWRVYKSGLSRTLGGLG